MLLLFPVSMMMLILKDAEKGESPASGAARDESDWSALRWALAADKA
jgi:hypothetical protein